MHPRQPASFQLSAFLLCALPLAAAAAFLGCHDSHHSSTQVFTSDPELFLLDTERSESSRDTTYTWDTTLTQARVDFHVRDFDGFARLRVYDGDGAEIFDEEYSSVHFDENEHEVDATGLGTPGTWHLRLELFDFSGHLKLLLDDQLP